MKYFLLSFLSICQIIAYAENYNLRAGDIIEIDGHKAMVFTTDDTGEHGTAMYVKALRGVDSPWCKSSKHAKRLLNVSDNENGWNNTKTVISYATCHNALSYFPAFEWCYSLGPNWYIPSLKELEGFINFWLGNEEVLNWDDDSEVEVDSDKPFYKEINQKLLDAGGTPFINGVYTSTIDSDGKVYVFYYDRRKNTWSLKRKNNTSLGEDCVGRAFVKF